MTAIDGVAPAAVAEWPPLFRVQTERTPHPTLHPCRDEPMEGNGTLTSTP